LLLLLLLLLLLTALTANIYNECLNPMHILVTPSVSAASTASTAPAPAEYRLLQVDDDAVALLLLPHVTVQRTPGVPNPLGEALVEGKWQV
jgi:hypothetical protein